mmetsp:Transcript_12784/g.21907  ORF Transcript_12784/g.21907 Transcript_12784/m.21907 type:complete len:221 (-) Transcript_12784:86-748(-)
MTLRMNSQSAFVYSPLLLGRTPVLTGRTTICFREPATRRSSSEARLAMTQDGTNVTRREWIQTALGASALSLLTLVSNAQPSLATTSKTAKDIINWDALFSPKSTEEINRLKKVEEVGLRRSRITELVSYVKSHELLTEDDILFVKRFIPIWIQPIVGMMQEAVATVSDERLKTLPQLMTGHLLELQVAVKLQDGKQILNELDEIEETVDEFLGNALWKK